MTEAVSIAALLASGSGWRMEHGSMLDILPRLPENSVDSVVTDCPYGLGKEPDVVLMLQAWLTGESYAPNGKGGFMGREWDAFVPGPHYWRDTFRVLKPGGHLVTFAGTRTVDLIGLALRMAGFEIRDSFSYFYGTGFPKSLNVTDAIAQSVCSCPEAIPEYEMRSVQNPHVQEAVSTRLRQEILLDCLPEQGPQEYGQERAKSEHGRSEEPCLEGRRDVLPEARELQADQVRSLPSGSPGDGEEGRLRDGAPTSNRARGGAPAAPGGSRASRRSRPSKQRTDQSRDVAGQPQPQAPRSWPTCRRCCKPVVPPGLGTALKPSHEPVILARKPLAGTVAANVLEHGTGALNVIGCRVAHASPSDLAAHEAQVASIKARGGSMANSWANASDLAGASDVNAAGRWPPNVLLTHSAACVPIGTRAVKANPTWDTPNRDTQPSAFTGKSVSQVRHTEDVVVEYDCAPDCPVRELDGQSGIGVSKVAPRGGTSPNPMSWNAARADGALPAGHSDTGTASRFFPQTQWDPQLDDVARFYYCAKASRGERDAGLEHFRARTAAELTSSEDGQARLASPRTGAGRTGGARNPHPTVKPVDLLRWLVRLVTPPRGVVLDPFAGSGSCGMAAIAEGFRYLGCELNDTDEEPFATIARARITWMEGGNYVPRESLRAPNGPKQRSLFDTDGAAE